MSQLLDDLDAISQSYSRDNDAFNFQQLIVAIGKHGNLQRILKESTDKQTQRLEVLSWIVGISTIISTIATLVGLCN